MSEFKIRAYGRMELAQLYSPQLTDIAAYRKMKKWIRLCPGLLQRLYDLGYQPNCRSFTPLEVRVIIDAVSLVQQVQDLYVAMFIVIRV